MPDKEGDLMLKCECQSPDHIVVFQSDLHDDECGMEFYLYVQLNQWHGFWKRVRLAIDYVLDRESEHGHWDCWMLAPEDAEKLRDMVDEFVVACRGRTGQQMLQETYGKDRPD